jgi:nitrate/nitrite transport system substrate-binding protein
MSEAGLEKQHLTLGYMPLTDCLPLIVALENGYFADKGLEVELRQEVSWANIRDKVTVGHLDGAHMLAPMVLATTLGLSCLKMPMVTGFSMGLNGNALTLSLPLIDAIDQQTALNPKLSPEQALRCVVDARRTEGKPALVIASVFPYSCHSLQLRYWLASANINPDTDIQIAVLPPSQMVDHLALGHIDGFIAGAPWNSVSISRGIGNCLTTAYSIWQNSPEKVFGVTADWAEKHPNTHIAVIQSLYQACEWLEHHRAEAADMLASYIDIDPATLLPALTGNFVFGKTTTAVPLPDMLVFNRYLANYPFQTHAAFLLEQMARWQDLPAGMDLEALAKQCFRPDIYQQALPNSPIPTNERLTLGENSGHWKITTQIGEVVMGGNALCDGSRFTQD